MICAGIDAGSRAIKIVLLDSSGPAVLASAAADQGLDPGRLSSGLLAELLERASIRRGDLARIVATGYARQSVREADTTITEITCHARGVRHAAPEAMTVVEIGGQDSKLLRLHRDGAVRDFAMNDRCAAGTGRFLEVVSGRLGLGIADMGRLAAASAKPARISSTCVVFAETEIIGLLADGGRPEDIVAGVQNAIASRVAAMAGRDFSPPVVFTGGVALTPGMDRALAEALETPVRIAPDPQMTGALGAAILAAGQVGA